MSTTKKKTTPGAKATKPGTKTAAARAPEKKTSGAKKPTKAAAEKPAKPTKPAAKKPAAPKKPPKAEARPGSNGKHATHATGGEHWIGGRLPLPFIVEGDDAADGAFRPDIALWCDADAGLVVGSEIIPPDAPASTLAEVLERTMRTPMVGAPRRPARVRIADEALVPSIQAVLGDGAAIEVAPTPELEKLVELIAQNMPDSDEEPSYLEAGRVSEAAVSALFKAAARLHKVAPWKVIGELQLIGLDVPELGIEGACVSVIGAADQSRAILVFDSLNAFESYLEAAEEIDLEDEDEDAEIDLGSRVLALDLQPRAEIPKPMRDEAKQHGWRAASAEAWPMVVRRDTDGMVLPHEERDVRIATAAALAACRLAEQHADLFQLDAPALVKDELVLEDEAGVLTVRYTAPAPGLVEEGPLS